MNITSSALRTVNSLAKWAMPAKKMPVVFEVAYVKNSCGYKVRAETGWLGNFKGGLFEKPEDAILVHGSRQAGLVHLNGKRVTAKQFADEIKSVYNVDLSASEKPIHLAACHVSTQFAQDLADVTKRTVKTYDDGKPISASSKLKNLRVLADDGSTKKPTRKFMPLDTYWQGAPIA